MFIIFFFKCHLQIILPFFKGFSKLVIDTYPSMESLFIKGIKSANHQCSLCGYLSPFPSHLKRHYLSHSSERNFPCSLCEKKFKHKESLDYHLRVHVMQKL